MKALEKRVKTCKLIRKMQMNQEYAVQLGLLDQSGKSEERLGKQGKNTRSQ